MDLEHLLMSTAAGVPVAMWIFLAIVTLVSIGAAVRWVGRPAGADQGA